jgi:hypothetical protein
MSKSITITVPNDVFATLKAKMGKLEKSKDPGMNVSQSAYVSIAIKEKLLREGEQMVKIPEPDIKVVSEPPVEHQSPIIEGS